MCLSLVQLAMRDAAELTAARWSDQMHTRPSFEGDECASKTSATRLGNLRKVSPIGNLAQDITLVLWGPSRLLLWAFHACARSADEHLSKSRGPAERVQTAASLMMTAERGLN